MVKKDFLALKSAKGPPGPIGRPHDDENIFLRRRDMETMDHGVINIFFPKFGVRGALNFDNGPKSYFENAQDHIKILVESALAPSNMAPNNA